MSVPETCQLAKDKEGWRPYGPYFWHYFPPWEKEPSQGDLSRGQHIALGVQCTSTSNSRTVNPIFVPYFDGCYSMWHL